tara:strand:- start:934 stop:1053 length:120 start_codon:yes stop_codon:yes gene_type:complete
MVAEVSMPWSASEWESEKVTEFSSAGCGFVRESLAHTNA